VVNSVLPAAPPPAVVQLSDAAFARQRGVAPGKGDKGKAGRRIASADDARVEVARARAALFADRATAQQAQLASSPDRVCALIFE
jgi:hypothetical protein